MGKSCLNKLSGNITVDCTIPQVGVKNIYLMHVEDVTFGPSADNLAILGATFSKGSSVILVEGYKQNIQVTGAIRTMDASVKMDINVIFKMPRNARGGTARARSLLMGKFYVLVDFADGTDMLVGYTTPLECSGVDWDSNANAGMMTFTLSAPEGAGGNYIMAVEDTAANQIKAKVGA